jgi:hypothetical protein
MPGSPMRPTLILPLILTPSDICIVEPPTSYISNVSFTFSKPKISGAIDHINFLRFSSAFEMFSMLSKSDLFLPMSSYDSLTF